VEDRLWSFGGVGMEACDARRGLNSGVLVANVDAPVTTSIPGYLLDAQCCALCWEVHLEIIKWPR
jgi:hypothetical protein